MPSSHRWTNAIFLCDFYEQILHRSENDNICSTFDLVCYCVYARQRRGRMCVCVGGGLNSTRCFYLAG